MPNPTRPAALLLATALALTGCGADVTTRADGKEDTTEADRHYPVTVENCGEKLTYAKAPQRVVTNDVGITEIMFALGLENHMAGYVMPDDKGDMTSVPWKDGYSKTKWLSKERINKELVLDADADLVFAGWNYGFNEGEGFTPAELKRVGVDSYLLSESCRNGQGKARGVMPPLDALYTDLRNLGKIFDAEDRAESLITTFRKQVADAQAKAPKGDDRPRVFLYDDGKDKPLTSGAYAGPHDIITKAGGDHIMKDLEDSWTTVGWETVVDRDPEVIVINNYGDTTADQKRAFLKSYKPLANVSAIKNDRIVVLDYVDLVESPRNPAAVSSLAEDLRKFAR
ncbi:MULTISPECIES: ABC transporter substrate-binding protein [unclassified Streptomyces]|uniref:ABC transporter substrate-binding protein n=1 Tax=unclassified Streptomyces TaxID=2593676 RepID=UPI000823B74B|nr:MULTISPECIES: ABC transporter substrate-binding protein [unclassified Streptomyces]MYT98766.1 ABC transporter substrate-binding protein [Streptomyces sp. SID8350]SCK21852.1 iron complex transport system substrate-binding protein [Streptomyces sp. AmelKG-D3]